MSILAGKIWQLQMMQFSIYTVKGMQGWSHPNLVYLYLFSKVAPDWYQVRG
jgi:hypothetical protein